MASTTKVFGRRRYKSNRNIVQVRIDYLISTKRKAKERIVYFDYLLQKHNFQIDLIDTGRGQSEKRPWRADITYSQ